MDKHICYNGYVVICETHNVGGIFDLNIIHDEELEDALNHGNKVIDKNKKIISKSLCTKDCDVYLDGLSLNNKIVYGYQQNYYNVFYEGLKLTRKNDIFNKHNIVSVFL